MALELDGEEATTPPRPPPPPVRPPPPPSNEQDAMRAWLRVQTDANAPDGAGPCQRSLHVAAVWRDRMLCFGGYDGSHRARSRRPVVWRRLHAIDATRVHQTRSWVVSFLILRPFGPSRDRDAPRRSTTAGSSTSGSGPGRRCGRRRARRPHLETDMLLLSGAARFTCLPGSTGRLASTTSTSLRWRNGPGAPLERCRVYRPRRDTRTRRWSTEIRFMFLVATMGAIDATSTSSIS